MAKGPERKKRAARVPRPPRWQICTEGITEANYLTKLIRHLGLDALVKVNDRSAGCHARGCGRQHEALLDRMQNCLQNWPYERAWLMHDLDAGESDPLKRKSFDETFRRGPRETGIEVIYFIPCFEYWLLLHLSPLESDLHRTECQSKVKEHCNRKRAERGLPPLHKDEYKTDPDLFDYFGGLPGVETACRNAKLLRKQNAGRLKTGPRSAVRPYSNLFELIDALQKRVKERENEVSGE